MIRTPKPKTQRARRALEKREAKIVENPKSAMFIKGHKTSSMVNDTLTDLYQLKKPDAALMKKKNQILPFEDATSIEFLSQKNDASLFALGSHTKKRPHNVILGRTFNHQMLDMFELGVTQFKGISEFKSQKSAVGSKHAFLFNGEIFEQKEEFKLLKSFFLDFYRGEAISSVNLAGLDHIISISASQEGKIYFRVYLIHLKKSGTRLPRIEVEEMGPSIDFELRRFQLASKEVMHEALKVPRTLKPKKVKNVSSDVLGKKYGRVHMQKQDFTKMATKKMKGLKRSRPSGDGEDNEGGEKRQRMDE